MIFFTNISVVLQVMDGWLQIVDVGQVSSEWTHIVLNYIGPNDGQGIRIYLDGVLTGSDDTKSLDRDPSPPGEGRIVVGREFTHFDDKYASVTLDELLIFNQTLSDQQILDQKDMF